MTAPSFIPTIRCHSPSFLPGPEGETRAGITKKTLLRARTEHPRHWSLPGATSNLYRTRRGASLRCSSPATWAPSIQRPPCWVTPGLPAIGGLPHASQLPNPPTLEGPAQIPRLPSSFLWSPSRNARMRRESRKHSTHLSHFTDHTSWRCLLCVG